MTVPHLMATHTELATYTAHRLKAGLFALVGWLCFSLACATPDIPQSLPAPLPSAQTLALREYRLGANDLIRVGVHMHPELSTPSGQRFDGTRIDPDGKVSLPLIGVIDVKRLTLDEARERITAAYAKFMIEPRVDLSVLEFAARRFYIYGDVQQPGAYVIDRPLNAYQALTFGGGFKPTAARDQIVLLRETATEVEVHIINGEAIEAGGLIEIHPDDFLFVMRSGTGRFQDQALPIIHGISSSLSSVATILLVEDRLKD